MAVYLFILFLFIYIFLFIYFMYSCIMHMLMYSQSVITAK